MNRIGFSILLFIFSFPFFSKGQDSHRIDFNPLLIQLEAEVAKGNLIALRDLGTLLDKKTVGKKAQNILKKYTFFLEQEFNWDKKTNRQAFLDFFYDNKNELRFFNPAGVFYLTALDVTKIDYKIESLPKKLKSEKTILLRRNINLFEKSILANDEKNVERSLTDIINLDTRESQHYLLQVLQERLLQKSKLKGKVHFIIILSQALQNYPTLQTLEIILAEIEKGFLPFKEAKTILSHLTNHSLVEINQPAQGVKYFNHLIDSLETMEGIRYAGYEQVFDFNKFIFPHEVDYYGRIVGLTDEYPWMKRNAIRDLMNTEHERAFLYLASDFHKNHLNFKTNLKTPILSVQEYEKFFIESNQLIIKTLDKDKKYQNIFKQLAANQKCDEQLKRNFLLYWMAHHVDFEWNQGYGLFINKNEMEAETEDLEKHFRRLNSAKTEAAMLSFKRLTVGSPVEVVNLANKYRQLLRSYNKALPNIRHQYLEQLSRLTEYCRNNNISYEPSKRLLQKLNQLSGDISNKERYELENRIINSLELDEITAVEYYGCLYEKNIDFTFSIGRILDHYYSRHWNLIIENDSQLRLFLKKAALFKLIGTGGSCNVYLTKLEKKSTGLMSRLNDLLEVEPDDDIIFLIESMIPKEVVHKDTDLNEFIEDPSDFSKNDIRVLPMASLEDFQKIIDKMKMEKSKKVLNKYLTYLRKNPTLDAVPIYFQLIDSQTFIQKKYDYDITLSDLVTKVIEGAYNHNLTPEKPKLFATDKWRELWKTDGKNYKDWVTLFFEQKLKQLEFAEKIKIDVINDVFASEHYKAEYKEDCLKALSKVRPFKKIKKLKSPHKFSVKRDLKYFEEFFFSYKDLDDIPKLFQVDEPTMLFDYLVKRSADFDESELGTFWNNIFRQGWFVEFINSNNNRIAEIKNIKSALVAYLNGSDMISEYEEQTTNLNIHQVESIGQDLISKLNKSIESQKDPATKALIQQSILARASFKDIGKILNILDQLSTGRTFEPELFLQKDFGLPIFDLDNHKISQDVISRHSKLSEAEFYKYYLEKFGVDFLNKQGALNFQKIFDLLQYEIVTPFVGDGANHRDQFTYGLIKLLELHFNDRLGFHEKLNENQTFYTFTNTKRASAWRAYLIEKRLAVTNDALPPSFNQIVNNQ